MLNLAIAASAATWHVAPSGADGDDRGGAAAPFATIQYAVGKAAEGDEIRVAGGVYTEAVASSVPRLTVSGSWKADFSARDLRANRTVIKAPNASSDCYTANAASNTLNGVDLTGGNFGFRGKCHIAKVYACNHHILSQCIISNNVTGTSDGGYWFGIAAISCLYTNNTIAALGTSDNGNNHYYYNCPFIDNGTAIERQHNSGPCRYVRNCAFLRNGKAVYANSTANLAIYLYRSAYWQNTQDFASIKDWKGMDGTYGKEPLSKINFSGPPLHGDFKLAADWTPQAGSVCIGEGEDLSADSVEPVTVDLYGTPWNGVYDFGCVKSGLMDPTTKLADVYVATTGDDSAAGDAAHPMATPEVAARRLADNGTLHLANGTYVGMVSIRAQGATIVGESQDGVILRPTADELKDDRPDFALGIYAQDVVVSNLTITAAGAGIYQPNMGTANNATIVRVSMTGNRNGYYQSAETSRAKTYNFTLSHIQVRNNVNHGLYLVGRTRIDNALIADNTYDGICANGWDNDSNGATYIGAAQLVVNSTICGNGTYAYRQVNTTHGYQYLVDTIIANNGYGVQMGKNGKIEACDFYDNAGGDQIDCSGHATVDANCIYTDPLLDTTATLRGHLDENSPCSQSGINVNSSLPYAITNDLDYVKRLVEKMDMGCYISPETMNDLAGEGYHIVNVTGDPDGYGTVTPAYGRHLVADGQLSLSAAGTLFTDTLDGVRATSVSDGATTLVGVRAAYKGYAYTQEGESEPSYQSDTAESLANITFDANATMTWKWERQNLIVASTDAPGCRVKINDGTPGTCVSNWVAQGTSYTVTFIPTSDFEFDSWGGDISSTADTRYQTTTVTSDQPCHFVPNYRSLIHVSKSGSDATGDGTTASPFASITNAVAHAKMRDVLYVQTGLYEENVVNTTLDQITFRGGYDANWQRDLRGAPTIVRSPSTSKHVFEITGVASNTVSGFVVCGGNDGFYMTGPAKPRNGTSSLSNADRALCMHVIEQCVVSNCSWGIAKGDGWCGTRAVSCLVVRNKSGGMSFAGDNRCYGYAHNCTVVSNAGYGVSFGYGYASYDMRNCLVDGNSGNYGVEHNQSSVHLTAWNNLVRGKQRSISCSGGFYALGPTFGFEPKLNADFSLADDSPAVGAGCNLHDYPMYAELYDLYGTPWNGVYDLGCIKSASAGPEKRTDVYVAPDGDDANDGASAATPMKTLQLAERHVAPGGTLHLAAGEYAGPLALTADGMTLAGAGDTKTFIRGTNISFAADVFARLTVHTAAHNVKVRDLAVTDALVAGLNLGISVTVTNALAERCTFSANKYGVYYYALNSTYASPLIPEKNSLWARDRLSHCRVVDNTSNGIDVEGGGYCAMIGDNLLVARNGGNGLDLCDWSSNGVYTHSYFYFCTIADNAGVGITNVRGYDSGYPHLVNSIVSGNGTGVQRTKYGDIEVSYCVVSENGTDWNDALAVFGNTNHINTGSAAFNPDTRRRHAFHLTKASAAIGWARPIDQKLDKQEYTGPDDKIAEPADDLDGVERHPGKSSDAGCFRYGGRWGFILRMR